MNDFLYQIEGRNPHFSQKEKNVLLSFELKVRIQMNGNRWLLLHDNNKIAQLMQPLITKHYIMAYYSGDWNMGGWENVEIFQNTLQQFTGMVDDDGRNL